MRKSPLLSCLKETARTCTALDIDFALVGGMALAFRATERTTKDIDIAVAVESDDEAETIIRSLLSRGFTLSTLVEQKRSKRLATARMLFPPPANSLILDFLFASCGIEALIVKEAEKLNVLPGLKMKVARTPHLLAMKILSMDRAGRSRDMDDARALIKNSSKIELAKTDRLLGLITARGYNRGRRLSERLARLVKEVRA